MSLSYRGFDYVILPAEAGFQVAVLNNGNPILVTWNGRTTWHSRHRARQMAHQFIRITLKWNPIDNHGKVHV